MKPSVIVVNGFPEAGKDMFCSFATDYNSVVHSTVDLIKEIALTLGWDEEKTPENRNMLSSLKDWYDKWFDGTVKDIVALIEELDFDNQDMIDDKDYAGITENLFIHAREPADIKRVVEWCAENDVDCHTVFIDRPEVSGGEHGNHADSNVCNFEYSNYILNSGSIEDFKVKAKDFFDNVVGSKRGFWADDVC